MSEGFQFGGGVIEVTVRVCQCDIEPLFVRPGYISKGRVWILLDTTSSIAFFRHWSA